MRLKKTDREEFRKMVNILIPQMKKIRNHFKKEDYPRQTIFDTLNLMQFGEKINDKKKTGRPTSWTLASKIQLKRQIRSRQFGHFFKRMLASFLP